MPTPKPPVAPPGDPSNAQQHTLVALEEEFGDTVTQGVMNAHLRQANLLEGSKPIGGSKQLTADQENELRKRFGGGDPASEQPQSSSPAPRTRSAARKAPPRQAKQPAPKGTSPKTDTPLGGPMPASLSAPSDPVQPELPLPTPAVSPQLTLEEQAESFAKQGVRYIKERLALHDYVVDNLATVYQVPAQYSISELNTAATAAVDLQSEVTDLTPAPATPSETLPSPDPRLLAKAMVAKKKGEGKGRSGTDLREYIEDHIDDLYEWKRATEAGRKSVLTAAMAASSSDVTTPASSPKVYSSELMKSRIASLRTGSFKRTALFCVVGLVLVILIVQLSRQLMPDFRLQGQWLQARNTGIVLFLVVLLIATVAVWRRSNDPEADLTRPRKWAIGLVLIILVLYVMPSGPAGEGKSATNPDSRQLSQMLQDACSQADGSGSFKSVDTWSGCANTLRAQGLKATDTQVLLGNRAIALSVDLEVCQQQKFDIKSDPGKIAYAKCAADIFGRTYGPDVFTLIGKGSR